MSNRKQRRAQQKLLRQKTSSNSGPLNQVAGLLRQVDDLKGGLQAITDKVAGDEEGLKFARLLCKIEDEVLDEEEIATLNEEDKELLKAARELIK